MAKSHEEDLAMQEVDDALRRERLENIWKSYAKYIIGVAVSMVVIVGGREVYKSSKEASETENSKIYSQTLAATAKTGADSKTLWAQAADDMGATYAGFAKFHLAASQIATGKIDEALATYDAVAADSSLDKRMQDLATYLSAVVMIENGKDLSAARSKLSLLTTEGGIYEFNAKEQLALIDYMAGNYSSANAALSQLSAATNISPEMRTRVQKMISMVESKLAENKGE